MFENHLIRPSVWFDISVYDTLKSRHDLSFVHMDYNSRNGLDDNHLEDENEYNLNGMNYDYSNDHPLPRNELIVSNQPTQKSTLSVGVSTASFR